MFANKFRIEAIHLKTKTLTEVQTVHFIVTGLEMYSVGDAENV